VPATILTDGATFKCAHQGTGTVASGVVSISAVASNVTIDGHKPILAGAIVSLSPASGCQATAQLMVPQCSAFTLPPPSEQTVTIGGLAVYTAADEATIALAINTGNSLPGLQVSESQTLVSA